jgi:hypothetical protein
MDCLRWLCASLALGSSPGAAGQAPDGTAQPAGSPAAQGSPDAIDPEALDVLTRMAETLSRDRGFRVTIRAGYDVVQDSGHKLEFGERRTVTLVRPDLLRVETEGSDGRRNLVVFDGKEVVVFDPGENAYGRVELAGNVDDAVRYLVRDLQVRLPLALLLVSTLPAELGQRVEALEHEPSRKR